MYDNTTQTEIDAAIRSLQKAINSTDDDTLTQSLEGQVKQLQHDAMLAAGLEYLESKEADQ